MTLRLVFAHGWGSDHSLWDAVLAELPDLASRAIVTDAGYFGRPSGAGWLAGSAILGIGQSLGALELMTNPPAPLAGLVAIDAFARFSAAPDFPAGRDVGKLRSLMGRLARAPPERVSDVIDSTLKGAAPPGSQADSAALASGIERLISLDARPVSGFPIWRLHAADDPTAPLAMSDASFIGCNARTRLIRAGSDHLSPIFAPKLCAELIRSAAKTLSEDFARESMAAVAPT